LARVRRIVLIVLVVACGEGAGARASLDWSLPVSPTPAPPASPPPLEVSGTRLVEAGGGTPVRSPGRSAAASTRATTCAASHSSRSRGE
jgi:hypothetical protein